MKQYSDKHGLQMTACEHLDHTSLDSTLAALHTHRDSAFDEYYTSEGDNRKLSKHHHDYSQLMPNVDTRDGKCAMAAMMLVHHVPKHKYPLLKALRLPLMPTGDRKIELAQQDKKWMYPCLDCHSSKPIPALKPGVGKIMPYDGNPHGWDRLRRCDQDYQNNGMKKCGLCEGIGGIATSDNNADIKITTCKIVKTAAELQNDSQAQIAPSYPSRFKQTGFYDHLVGVKKDPFCLQSNPGPDSTGSHCYSVQKGTFL